MKSFSNPHPPKKKKKKLPIREIFKMHRTVTSQLDAGKTFSG